MAIKRITVPVITAADGSATVYSARTKGKLQSVSYVKDGTTPFDNTVDFAITLESTGEGVWTESNITASTQRYPRANSHSQVGAALLYAAGGANVGVPIALSSERFKIVLAQGGNAKLGSFVFMVED